jgi:hypothetical protein
MTVADDLDQVIEQYYQALDEFMKGDPEPVWKLHSHQEDVTLANPRGGIAHGWDQVAKRMADVASDRREGGACLRCGDGAGRGQVWRKRGCHLIRSSGYDTLSTRRRHVEVAHRHADPISSVQQAASYEVE